MKLFVTCLLALWVLRELPAQPLPPTRPTPAVEIIVHPGIELFTIVQLLAGQYRSPNPSAYAKEVETYFKPFASHPAVQHVKKMGRVYADLAELGYCFDQFPAVRVYYPDSLNWYTLYGKDTVQAYMRLCQDFATDTKFWDFYQRHRADYIAWAKPVEQELARQGLVAKLDSFYRFKSPTAWTICLDPLNSWGAHAITAAQLNPRYANRVVYNVGFFDEHASDTAPPVFGLGAQAVTMVWHEGSHIYTQPLRKRYAQAIDKLAYLLNEKDPGMKRNNIHTWSHCFDENLVRGIVIALFGQFRSANETRKQNAQEIVGDFIYAEAIAEMLTREYLPNPAYPNFASYFPHLLTALAHRFPAPFPATR